MALAVEAGQSEKNAFSCLAGRGPRWMTSQRLDGGRCRHATPIERARGRRRLVTSAGVARVGQEAVGLVGCLVWSSEREEGRICARSAAMCGNTWD